MLCRNLHKGWRKKIKDQQNETFEKAEKLNQKTKKSLVAENAKMVERSRAKHRQILEKAYKPKTAQDQETQKKQSCTESDTVVAEPEQTSLQQTSNLEDNSKPKKRELHQVSLVHSMKKKK